MFAFGREKPDGTVEYLGMSASDSQAYLLARKLSLDYAEPIVSFRNDRSGSTALCCRFVAGNLVWAANPETPAQKRCCGVGQGTAAAAAKA